MSLAHKSLRFPLTYCFIVLYKDIVVWHTNCISYKEIQKINQGGVIMTLVKFNPARDLLDVEREFNKMFSTLGSRFGITRKGVTDEEYDNAVWMPLTDISEDKDNFYLKADLPGIKKEDVKISYTDGTLSISGERNQEKETKDKKFHRIERSYGNYFRSFNIPTKIKEDKINAEFKDGQLTISIPKAEEVKPKEIDIKVS